MNNKKDYAIYINLFFIILIVGIISFIFIQKNKEIITNNIDNDTNETDGNENIEKNIDVNSISITNGDVSLKVNESVQLNIKYNPSNATNKKITWNSSNNNIASIDSNGVVSAKSGGEATITATSHNNKKASIKVKVINNTPSTIDVNSISITNGDVSLKVNESVQLTIKYNPSNATNKKITWNSSNTKVVTVSNNGVITAKSSGSTNITATSHNNKTSTIKITVKKPNVPISKYLDVYFLNTYNTPEILSSLQNDDQYQKGYTIGESFIVKTIDNKYVLIDTSFDNKAVTNGIYNELKSLQKKTKVSIDYLVLTHSHSDHTGGASKILNNKNISINKLIMKKESHSKKNYNNISSKFNSSDIVKLKEGMKIALGKHVDMYIFNTSDVFANKNCHIGYALKYSSKINKAQKINGSYYYFDGSKYPNIEILKTDKLVEKENSKNPLDKYFYAYPIEDRTDCNENANSLAILFKVKTDDGNRYMYIVGDLDNNGYGIIPIDGVYGNGANMVYKSVKDMKYSSSLKNFVTPSMENAAKSETKTAKRVKKLLGDDISNIKIYQMSHHVINNAPDAIKTLKLNRSDLYAIAPTKSLNKTSFFTVRTHYYTLSKAKKLYVGGTNKKGIYCYFENTGKTLCQSY